MRRNIEFNDIGAKVTPSTGDARLVMLQVRAALRCAAHAAGHAARICMQLGLRAAQDALQS